MASAFRCIACDAGDCVNCHDTAAPPGVLGGNTCPCDHNEGDRKHRRQTIRDMFTALARPDGDPEEVRHV